MTKPRALLTGRSGFTGRYVARELEQAGYEVFGLSNHGDDGKPGLIRANLLDRDAVRDVVAIVKPDVVLHLAAVAFVAHGDVDEMYRVNVVGARNLLDALDFAVYKPKLVVLASSANIYGNVDVDPILESTPAAPANDYAVSKLAMEYMARLWMDKLPIVITRPFNYTGVGQSEQFLIPKIVEHFRRGDRKIELGNVNVIRDFGDVRDVARTYIALVQGGAVGQIFNICTGRGHSLGEILDIMGRIANYKIAVDVNPAFVRENEVAKLIGSRKKLDDFSKIEARHDIEDTLRWMFYSGAEQ